MVTPQSRQRCLCSPRHPNKFTRLDISDRNNVKIIEQYAGAICGMKQPEAIAFTTASEDGKKVRMLVGGEPTELLIFEADVDCDKKLNSTEGAVFSCPDLAATVGCDMTIEGGRMPATTLRQGAF